jgi:virginiamycin B lyase
MKTALLMLLLFCCCGLSYAIEPSTKEKPTSHYFKEFDFLTPKAGPSIVACDAKGNIWIALARAGKLGVFCEEALREYALPTDSFPVGLAIDSLGQVWYSDIRRNKIARLDPKNGAVKDYPVPTADSWPFFIVVAPDGKLWFTERIGNRIGRLDPVTGEIVEFDVPTKNCQPAGMTITPDGQIYFTENSGNKIGHFDPKTEQIVEYEVPTPMTPSPFYGLAGIASDRQGDVWFAEVDGRLGLIRHGQTRIEEIPVPNPHARPAGVLIDSWGFVWFTELDGNCISSYNPVLREFRRYQIPTGYPDPRPMGPPETTARGEMPIPGSTAKTSRPFGITADLKGRIWFSEQYAHKLGRLTPPELEVFAPVGLISGPVAPVKVQIRTTDRDDELCYLIDKKPVVVAERLDVGMLAPGPHTFTVARTRRGWPVQHASTVFSVNPGIATINHLIQAATPADMRLELKRELQSKLQILDQRVNQGDTGVGRELVRGMIATLASQKGGISLWLGIPLMTHLRHLDTFGKREYQIEVRETPPFFKPSQLEIEVGDAVRWSVAADHPVNLNSASYTVTARDGSFTSRHLEPGSPWSHTLYQEGRCEYVSASQPDRTGVIIVKPRTTQVLEFPLPGPARVPGVLAIDPEDNVWFTEGGGGFSRLGAIPLNNKIGRISPTGKITEYETPTMESGPTSIHVGKEGHIWFTERAGNHIGELDPKTGRIREYAIPTPMSGATGISVDKEGHVWFAEKLSSKIGTLDPATAKIIEYDTPTPKSQPSTIMVDDSGIVWFDERANDKIVSLNRQSGQMKEYPVPTPGSRVVGLVADHHGYIWFLQLAGNKVGRLHIETGSVTEFTVPTKYCSPFKLAIDSSGRIWFTEAFGNKVGVLDGGRFYEFAIPTKDSMPGGIGIDSKGNIWFTEQAGNQLAVIPYGELQHTIADDDN